MRLTMSLPILLVLSACTGLGSGDATESPSPIVPTQTAEPTATAEQTATARPTNGAVASSTLTGLLGADTVEGGCGYLEARDGTRYEVLWPDGWELQLEPLELHDPDGTVVATAGDEVTVRGEEATDMGSFCQIGPIFEATEVDR
jgi:hypothetical protein